MRWGIDEQRGVKLKQKIRNLVFSYNVGSKLKIIIGFYMIATKIPTVYETTLPAELRSILDFVDLIITIGLTNLTTGLQCIGAHRFESILKFWIVMPFVAVFVWMAIAAVLVAMGKWGKWGKRHGSQSDLTYDRGKSEETKENNTTS